MLGEDWQQTQVAWLNKLGNLTLTGYNSEYSDRPFEEKKTIKGGFNESSVRLNRFVRDQAVWTKNEMQERGQLLARKALTIWAPLVIDEQSVKRSEQDDIKALAGKRSLSSVPMSAGAQALFELLRPRVNALGTGRASGNPFRELPRARLLPRGSSTQASTVALARPGLQRVQGCRQSDRGCVCVQVPDQRDALWRRHLSLERAGASRWCNAHDSPGARVVIDMRTERGACQRDGRPVNDLLNRGAIVGASDTAGSSGVFQVTRAVRKAAQ